MTKTIVMLSGLPRSGSTVLTSILNQHPNVQATTTSPVADLITGVIETWPNISQAIIDPNPKQYGNILNSVIQGAHQHVDKSTIIDKNRLWPRIAPTWYHTTDAKLKIICTVRDIPDILASYILLFERNLPATNFVDQDLIEMKLPVNNKNRCKILWEKYIGHPYNSLKIGYNSRCADMLFVDYTDIVFNAQITMDKICNFIGIGSLPIDTNDLRRMDENDKFHGGIEGLHYVRPILEKTSPAPHQVIGHELTQYYKDMKLNFWQ